MRSLIFVLLFLVSAIGASIAQPNAAPLANGCGEVVTIETHDRTTTRYTLARAQGAPAQDARIAMVLLVGLGKEQETFGGNSPVDLSRGQDSFKKNCVVCHVEKGLGDEVLPTGSRDLLHEAATALKTRPNCGYRSVQDHRRIPHGSAAGCDHRRTS